MQIKKVAESIVGSFEKKLEDSKPSEATLKSGVGQSLDQYEIKQSEARTEKERDAAWMGFGASIGAAAGAASSAVAAGIAASSTMGNLAAEATKNVLQKSNGPAAEKTAIAEKTMSEILSAKLTEAQVATQAAMSVVTGGAAVAGQAASVVTGIGVAAVGAVSAATSVGAAAATTAAVVGVTAATTVAAAGVAAGAAAASPIVAAATVAGPAAVAVGVAAGAFAAAPAIAIGSAIAEGTSITIKSLEDAKQKGRAAAQQQADALESQKKKGKQVQ
jgi:hypothetical protein